MTVMSRTEHAFARLRGTTDGNERLTALTAIVLILCSPWRA
jgi:hypothetical protein